MPISFSGVTVTGYNASPPPDDGTSVASNQLSWSKHLTKIGGPLKTALEELNANLITAFGLGAAQADAALLAASNVMTLSSQSTGNPQFHFYADRTVLKWTETDAAADNKIWTLDLGTGAMSFNVWNDALGVVYPWLVATRSGAAIATLAFTATGFTMTGALTTPNTSASEFGYKGAPQNIQNGDYTLVLTDSGKSIVKASGGAGETITIPANASVAFPEGTIIAIVNGGGGDLSIAITSDTMYLAGAGSTGTRTLANTGMATLYKLSSTVWIISGTGVS